MGDIVLLEALATDRKGCARKGCAFPHGFDFFGDIIRHGPTAEAVVSGAVAPWEDGWHMAYCDFCYFEVGADPRFCDCNCYGCTKGKAKT